MRSAIVFAAGAVLGSVLTAACSYLANADEDVIGATKPAYLVVSGEVTDREAFMAGYAAKLGPLYERHGGQYLAIGSNHETLEGSGIPSLVISEWPSADAARAFWYDPEYELLKKARIDGEWGTFDVWLVEGFDVPVQANPAVSQIEN